MPRGLLDDGAQNDAVEALELLAAALADEVRGALLPPQPAAQAHVCTRMQGSGGLSLGHPAAQEQVSLQMQGGSLDNALQRRAASSGAPEPPAAEAQAGMRMQEVARSSPLQDLAASAGGRSALVPEPPAARQGGLEAASPPAAHETVFAHAAAAPSAMQPCEDQRAERASRGPEGRAGLSDARHGSYASGQKGFAGVKGARAQGLGLAGLLVPPPCAADGAPAMAALRGALDAAAPGPTESRGGGWSPRYRSSSNDSASVAEGAAAMLNDASAARSRGALPDDVRRSDGADSAAKEVASALEDAPAAPARGTVTAGAPAFGTYGALGDWLRVARPPLAGAVLEELACLRCRTPAASRLAPFIALSLPLPTMQQVQHASLALSAQSRVFLK